MSENATDGKIQTVHPEVDAYMRLLAGRAQFPRQCQTLERMERLAERRDFPIIGGLAGRFLFQQALICGARSVFEMGSGFGYSAWWFAKAVGTGGAVFCTDKSPENRRAAEGFMKEAGLENTVVFETGDAVAILEKTDRQFDIVFNDIDKRQYPQAFAAAREKVKTGGLFIADNAFWDGRAARPGGDADSEGVAEFNRIVTADADFVTVQVPIRDGISVSFKLR